MGVVLGTPGTGTFAPDPKAEKEMFDRLMESALSDRSSDLYKNWKAVLFDDSERHVSIAEDWCNENIKMAWAVERIETIGFPDIPDYRFLFRNPKDAALFRLFFG